MGGWFGESHFEEDGGGVEGAGGAGGAGAGAESSFGEGEEEGFGFESGEGDVGGVPDAGRLGAVDGESRWDELGAALDDGVFEVVAEVFEFGARGWVLEPFVGFLGGGSGGGDGGHGFGASSSSEFLGSGGGGDESGSGSGVEDAQALWAVELVGGAGEERDGGSEGGVVGVEVDGGFPDALGCVAVEGDVVLGAERADGFDVLDGSGFVVDPLGADERGSVVDEVGDGVGVDAALGIDVGEADVSGAFFLEGLGEVPDGGVFDPGGDDGVSAGVFVREEGASEGHCDGFGPGPGEDDGSGAGAEEGGELGAGGFEGAFGFHPESVDGGGVGPGGAHGAGERFDGALGGLCGGVVVEVDHGGS